jgi:hypothetical protein
VRIERLALTDGRVGVIDESTTPQAAWDLDQLAVEVKGLSTVGEDPPATGNLKGRLTGATGAASTVEVGIGGLRIAAPFAGIGRVSLADFDLAALMPYVPPDVPRLTVGGRLSAELQTDFARQEGTTDLARGNVTGTVGIANLVVAQPGASAPILKLPKLAVALRQADVVGRAVHVRKVEMDGMDARITRDAQGVIDVVVIADGAKRARFPGAPPDPAAASAPPAPPPPTRKEGEVAAPLPVKAPGWQVVVDRIDLRRGTATFDDSEPRTHTLLVVNDLTVVARKLRWPTLRGTAPGTLEVTAGLPGGGLFLVEASASLEPLDITFQVSTLDVPIEPYQAYFPFPARFKGLFSGDSLNTIKIEDGKFLAASQGNAFAKQIEVSEPGAASPALTLERMEIRGIDFSWPNYAFVSSVSLLRPEARIERGPDGTMNLRRMFEPFPKAKKGTDGKGEEDKKDAAPEAILAGATAEPKKPDLLQTMVLDFDRITIEEGYQRFLDQTTKPPFSQDLGRLALTIRNLSNAPGRRATLSLQGIVGGDAALDMRGEMSRLGDDFFADLVGELRDFSVASANPYANSFLAWVVKQGKLGLKVHYRIERDRLTGENEIVVKNLQVAKGAESDEVQKRLGLPLGLIVALMKDSRGDITFEIPISGNINDKQMDWGETIWAAVKQVVLKVLASPFRSIGRMFTGGDDTVQELKVDPVVFAAGSSVIGPAMEGHLNRVGQFLRDTPAISLALSPTVTAKDFERLRGQELTAKIQRLQRERGIPDYAEAVGRYYLAQNIPGEALKTADEQLKVLVAREALPDERIRELLDRRVATTRDRLTKTEQVAPERLLPGEPHVVAADLGDGRVEFAITTAE